MAQRRAMGMKGGRLVSVGTVWDESGGQHAGHDTYLEQPNSVQVAGLATGVLPLAWDVPLAFLPVGEDLVRDKGLLTDLGAQDTLKAQGENVSMFKGMNP